MFIVKAFSIYWFIFGTRRKIQERREYVYLYTNLPGKNRNILTKGYIIDFLY